MTARDVKNSIETNMKFEWNKYYVMSLLANIKDLYRTTSKITDTHSVLLCKINSLEITSVPVIVIQEYPLKFMIEISSFEEIAGISNSLCGQHASLRLFLDSFKEELSEIAKVRDKCRKLKLGLSDIKERLVREEKYFKSSMIRVIGILSDFKTRCRSDYTEYLKNLDYDIRLMLKPLVPNSVIESAVKYPQIQEVPDAPSNLNDSEKQTLDKEVNFIISCLENVPKELIDMLEDANRKYYEIIDPLKMGTRHPTPLAAPLPCLLYTSPSPRDS